MNQFILLVVLIMGYFFITNSKIKNKGSLLLEKVISAAFSALIISLYFAFLQYTPVEEQQVDVLYTSIEGHVIINLSYMLPVYLIFGTICSFLIDVYFNNIKFYNDFLTYITEFLVYIAGGVLIWGVLSFPLLITESISITRGLFNSLGFGVLSSLLFFHVSLFLRFLQKILKVLVKKT